MSYDIALVGLLLLIFLVTVLGFYYKLSHILHVQNRAIAKRIDDIFHQIEALNNIQIELNFRNALPPSRGWAASPDFLLVILNHVRRNGCISVLECGSGITTLILARCMELSGQGHVYS